MDKKGMKGQKGLKRIVVTAKDVQLITGKKDKGSRNLLKKIKMAFNKSKESFVTFDEFCIYTGLEMEDVKQFIKDI